MAELLRSRGATLKYDDVKASGELCEFARRGDVKAVAMLLKSGCSANAADYDLRDDLHLLAHVLSRSR